MPMAQKEKNEFSAPIFVGPSIATCDPRRHPSPSSTSAPITQYAPTLHEAGTRARGSMIAVGCRFGDVEFVEDGFIESPALRSGCYPASPFPVSSFDARPRELSINWHETVASATRLSPT